MQLPLQTFSTLLQNMAAGIQGEATELVDLSVGSVLRALMEASAAVALWMQWLILQVLAVTRAATSTGADLDSWMADFSLTRLPGAPSVGNVTFSRYTAGLSAIVPVGTTVSTIDGTQSFTVVQNSSNPAWNGVSGYLIGPMTSSVSVPAQAVTPGSAGNVLAGAIGLLSVAVPGVDSVTNGAAFTSGVDPESDAALRARFQLYINSRSLATASAVDFAIASLQQGLRYVVLENIDTSGAVRLGNFWVIVDDGTGSPPNSLIAAASAAVEAVRPLGATFAVTGPTVITVTVSMTVLTSNPATQAAVLNSIQISLAAWISGLPIAGTLAISKLEALAHAADPSVVSVSSTTINGVAADVTASASGVIICSSITVN